MTREQLVAEIRKKKSMLCVGLDTDLEKIPPHLLELEDPIFEFNKAIIDATAPFAVAYKPNMAFFEAYGVKGWLSMQKTFDYLNASYPEIFTVADAKRGDIGNTSTRYAKAFFEELGADSLTIAPYMGADSVKPFLEFEGKFAIVLGLTSNAGAQDFQLQPHKDGYLFEEILRTVSSWGSPDKLMFVVGATKTDYLKKVRAIIPDHFLLVPGVGAQGGSLEEVLEFGLGKEPNLLINSSRGVIYSSKSDDFSDAAAASASDLQRKMKPFIT